MKTEIKFLFATSIITSVSYSIVNAFFAPILTEKKIPENILGMIISIYAIMGIIFTPFMSYLTENYGRKNLFEKSLKFNVSKNNI